MISIIVPVYNAEAFLKKCVESIQAQTFAEWELLLVDDGSTDGSGALCDELAAADTRIRVLHKSNGGVSSARNAGIAEAKGDGLMFVDADDSLSPELCGILAAHSAEAEIVISGYCDCSPAGEQDVIPRAEGVLDKAGLETCFEDLYTRNMLNAPWAKLYSREMVGDLRYDEGVALGEDFLFNLACLERAKKISVVHVAGYRYNRMNESAATRSFRESDLEQIVTLYTEGCAFIKKSGIPQKKESVLEERLCINGINLLQLLFYTKHPYTEKKRLAATLLERPEYAACCEKSYPFSMRYKIPQELCRKKWYGGLAAFFATKRTLQKCMKMLHVRKGA